MKAKSILSAFIGVLLFAGISNAQHVRAFSGTDPSTGWIKKTIRLDQAAVRQERGRPICYLTYKLDRTFLPDSQGDDTYGLEILPGASGDIDTVLISYTGLEDGDLQFFEAVIPASTREGCLASSDFSGAVPRGPDRARSTYDPESGTQIMVWNNVTNSRTPSCRVLVVRSSVNASDYNVWRANYGQTGY